MANPRTSEIFGYETQELEGKQLNILLPDRIHATHNKHHKNYVNDPHPRSMGKGLDLFGKKKDGSEVPLEISLNPFEQENEQFVAAFIVDVTEKKRMERDLKQYTQNLEKLVQERTQELEHLNLGLRSQVIERKNAEAELLESQKQLEKMLENERELNVLKSRFVSMASHEFRTPLSTILSSMSLLERYMDKGEPEKGSKHIEKVKNSVRHLTGILEDFLSLGKLEEGKVEMNPEVFEVRPFLEEVLEDFSSFVKPGQHLTLDCPEGMTIETDKKMFRQVMINLISNAIKYSEEGNINITFEDSSKHYLISVSDQGMGIPNSDKKNMFSRFFRAGNAINIEGTGLGLNIVQKHLELLGGDIDFESEVGVGTTFYIRLKKS